MAVFVGGGGRDRETGVRMRILFIVDHEKRIICLTFHTNICPGPINHKKEEPSNRVNKLTLATVQQDTYYIIKVNFPREADLVSLTLYHFFD